MSVCGLCARGWVWGSVFASQHARTWLFFGWSLRVMNETKHPNQIPKKQMREVNTGECSPHRHEKKKKKRRRRRRKKKASLSQRRKQALNPFCLVIVLWMSSGWKHVLYINSMKTRLVLSPFSHLLIWWMSLEITLTVMPAQHKACEEATHSNNGSQIRLLKLDTKELSEDTNDYHNNTLLSVTNDYHDNMALCYSNLQWNNK